MILQLAARNILAMAASSLFQKILVPVDNAKTSIDAARLAFRIAQIHSSQLIFLHVVDAYAIDTMAEAMAHDGKESKESLLIKAKESGWHVLYALEEEAVTKHIRIALILEDGAPQHAILNAAEKYRVDLIVLGKHRKIATRKDMVIPAVVANADCSVLIAQ